MQFSGEKTASLVKKKGPGAKAEFLRMHLAVYPYEVEFLSPVDHATAFYFQKNYQVIGQIQQPVPPNRKHVKHQLIDMANIVHFRLHSPHNIVYKWSVYRRDGNGEEEYLDSCTLNLREAVNSFVGSRKDTSSRTPSSLIELGFLHKEMRLKFPKIGAILGFMLFVAAGPREIKEYVQRVLINKEQDDHILENMPQTTILKADSCNLQAQSTMKNQNSNRSIHKFNSSNPIFGPFDINQKVTGSSQRPIQPYPDKNRQQPAKTDPADSLGNLIMGFDVNGAITDFKEGHNNINLHVDSNPIQQVDDHELGEDFFKGDFESHRQMKGGASREEEQQGRRREEEKTNNDERDYGMLKLESDQGRVQQDEIDHRLELQELEAIEEEKLSRVYTVNDTHISPTKNRPLSKNQHPIIRSKAETQRYEIDHPSRKVNARKIIIIFVLFIFLFIMAATLSQKIRRRKPTQKKQREN